MLDLATKQQKLSTTKGILDLGSANYTLSAEKTAAAQALQSNPPTGVDQQILDQQILDLQAQAATYLADGDRECGAALAKLQAILGIPVSGTGGAPLSP